MSNTKTQPVRERKRELETADESSSEDELQVEGLLDGAESEQESESEQFESADEDHDQESDSDSDAEFNRILAEGSSGEDEDEDEPKEPSITDKLSGIKIRTLSSSSSTNGEVLTKFSDGRERILRPEIDPVYDSDDSDREETNTIGNVPLSAYDEYPHIGYDINGKRIMRPAQGSALDQLLESIDLPEGWTGLLDKETGNSLNISAEELELIRKIERNENPDESVNPYEPTIEWFTSKTETMPLTAVPEPKRRFVPSKHEAKRIMKIVKAIREGRIVPPHLKKQQEEEDELNFDLWGADIDNTHDHVMTLRAPKLPPPTNQESYNPPEEYLLSEEERKRWEETDPSERELNFLPQKYGALRKVPGYQESVRERFERCLDLYLAPRVRKQKLNIDPESLIPELPSPKDLKPFPVRTSTVYEGHTGRVRALSVHPSGNWLATGADDGTVRVWEVLTGRQLFQYAIVEDDEDHVEALEWNPKPDVALLAVTCGATVFLLVPPVFGFELENRSKLLVEDGWGYAKTGHDTVEGEDGESSGKSAAAVWHKPNEEQYAHGVCAVVRTSRGGSTVGTFKRVSWHRRGDYFVTVSPEGGNKTSVLIHQLSRHATQSPFRKSKGIVMDAKFHPSKPVLVVMSQRYIRIYNLQQQQLEKKLLPGARWLSCLDIHPRGGDHILAGSYDKRVLWHDLDLSATPHKTLRYHEKAVRAVAFHKGGYPLFCSASDDGSVHVFHGTVYDDLMSNPLLVPLKKLTGHKVVNNLGVLNVCWHPAQPWLFTAGADHTARLWTD
ncbi:uncharacterized protein OGAPODRAFT_102036 [Ogataea polymorpha]|uniref:uncharacterized protein n=1 Tax=Ogataea polymorpha TaxID=460523 RepID=UPI0007F510A5|nr:uncharacterized protein OGAPODRAFT_102036 [Ogataea polymorpha]OBA14117.1 hypothetical protein OGAPODRAFT_102036 [Ogataea polymorpha]